jgi:hypothetical protein
MPNTSKSPGCSSFFLMNLIQTNSRDVGFYLNSKIVILSYLRQSLRQDCDGKKRQDMQASLS